jgi:riboflavin biosynthesis pyrimidine reductase
MTATPAASTVHLDRLFAADFAESEADIRGGRLPEPLVSAYDGPLAIPLRPDRPTVVANFVSTIDGVVAFDTDWSSGGGEVSGFYAPDRFLMGALRTLADVVLIGAGTVRAAPNHEWTPRRVHRASAAAFADWRRQLGLAEQPTTMVVSASGELDLEHPGLSAGDVPVVVVTTESGEGRLPGSGLREGVTVVAAGHARAVSARAVVETAARLGARLVLCEGGAHLLADLVEQRLVDELFLTIAPQIAGRDPDHPRLALVEGAAFSIDSAPWGRLISVHRSGDYLFLRFALGGPQHRTGQS